MIAWLEAKAWMILTGATAALALVLGAGLMLTKGELRRMQGERNALHGSIYNEHTGYIVRLNQCHSNVAQLDVTLREQNASVEALKTEVDVATERANRAIADKASSRKQAERDAAAILSMKPGADKCTSALSLIKGLP